MSVSISSEVLRSEGLRHVLAVGLVGERDELLRVREVVYDLGPTFVERHRTRKALDGLVTGTRSASAFRIEVEAYGDFDMSARLAVGDGKVEDLTHTVVVAAKRSETQEAIRTFDAPASAGGANWTGAVLGTSAVALASAALVVGGGEQFWPGSTVESRQAAR